VSFDLQFKKDLADSCVHYYFALFKFLTKFKIMVYPSQSVVYSQWEILVFGWSHLFMVLGHSSSNK